MAERASAVAAFAPTTAAPIILPQEQLVLRRTFDPALFNEVANHPDVRPWLALGEHALDLSPLIANPANFALATNGGGFVLICHEPGLYEVHSMFLPADRRCTREAMKAGLDYMFTRTDCETIQTQVPDTNRAAACLAKAAGFRPMFRREEGYLGPTQYMAIDVADWVQSNAALEADGAWFHAKCEAAFRTVRPDLPDHPADVAHDRAVGATVRMIRAGNLIKGVKFYNRWARLAGYTPARLLSVNPPVLDMSEQGLTFIAEVRDGDMEILLCQ